MKQFLQIHNTDCNKRRIFRRILLMKNALQSTQRHIEAHRIIGTRKTQKKRNVHLVALEINAILMWY